MTLVRHFTQQKAGDMQGKALEEVMKSSAFPLPYNIPICSKGSILDI